MLRTMVILRTLMLMRAALLFILWTADQSVGFFLGSTSGRGAAVIPPRWLSSPSRSTPQHTSCFLSSSSSSSSSLSSSSSSSNNKQAPAAAADISIPTEWQGQVLAALKNVIDPDLGTDIVSLGFVQNLKLHKNDNDDGRTAVVSFDVQLTTPACPVKDQFAADCERLVLELPWTSRVEVTMTAQQSRQETDTLGMQQIGAIIAVSSCKGGVGKSTTAVNLAFALQALGATVGIFDADVYGPSLPTMVQPDDDIVRFVGRQIAPLQRNGVRLMSFGYVNDGSAVMRGPMVTQLLDQFLSVTQWGPLDYLVIDMPPGTGDIQLTLTQRLNITAAVIVTTPQELSFVDVARGVEMFDSVNVPCIAVVENMAYYEVEKKKVSGISHALDREALKLAFVEKLLTAKGDLGGPKNGDDECSSLTMMDDLSNELIDIVLNQVREDDEATERVQIFGPGHKRRLSEQWGIEHTFSVPLLDRIAANGDSGVPFILEHADSPQAAIYMDLAKSVVSEVAKAKFAGQNNRPTIVYDKEKHVMQVNNIKDNVNNGDAGSSSISSPFMMKPADLRRACRCASCVEELTGRQILVPSSIPDNVAPMRMGPTGNYALSVDWSDGHRSLYPYRQIQSLVQEQLKSSKAASSEEKASTNQVPV